MGSFDFVDSNLESMVNLFYEVWCLIWYLSNLYFFNFFWIINCVINDIFRLESILLFFFFYFEIVKEWKFYDFIIYFFGIFCKNYEN